MHLFLPAWISFYVFLALLKCYGKQLASAAALCIRWASVEGDALAGFAHKCFNMVASDTGGLMSS